MFLRYGSVGGSGNQSASVMMTARWSERRVVRGYQVATTVTRRETIVRTVNELGTLFGTLEVESSLGRARLLVLMRSIKVLPREVAWSSRMRENQAVLHALKSPTMIVSWSLVTLCLKARATLSVV